MVDIKKHYQRYAKSKAPPKPVLRNAFFAFVVGGAICVVGQGVKVLLLGIGLESKEATSLMLAIMVLLGAFLTGIGVYDKITKVGGMGGALPITGFANSIVAPAMEYRSEGFVLGVGAKIFTVAGPVIVYGLLVSIAVAIVKWLLSS